MHFVVGLCLILLPFLIAYLIYYVIDLVYLMCVESCAKKGDTEAPADVSFSNPNFCKDAFAEDAKMDFLLMFCYTLVIILIQLMFLILKLMLSLDSAIYFENYKSKLSGEMEPTTIMIIAFLSMLLLAIIVIQCLEAAAAQEHRLFSDAIDYNNNARNLAQIV
ncbi:hypothetical protein QR680_015285 [Steinernema hermaphroditum]|uniref:Uncharacterized protein n=1 Tax=Steinernema hermaphroditum TaxID=289476 RepID=A0AA39LKK6_9BILA|nr:hypothetical protein QR680_015285 [Steinernema hermaphroditum]